MKSRTLLAGCLIAVGAVYYPFPPAHAGKAADTPTVQIGMAQTMVVDVPPPLVDFLGLPFSRLMKEFTGLNGNLEVGGGPFDVAQKLESGKVQLAVFQGLEFAWVQTRHPKIKPLMVAIYQNKVLNAQLVIRKDSTSLDSWADLRGKEIAFPRKSKEHCRAFLERNCTVCGDCAPQDFFGGIARPGSAEAALDDLIHGKCQAAICDKVDVEFYRRIKPGAFNQLRILKDSEPFPSAVIAYVDGGVDGKVLERFRGGMLKANNSERGRDMMSMWRITSFEEVPGDYQRTVDEILRSYPVPEAKTP